MGGVDGDLARIRSLLRRKIHERGFTQKEVQEFLGWGRHYVSMLVTGRKPIRVEQVLLILNVIGVTPEEFWGEVYGFGEPRTPRNRRSGSPLPPDRGRRWLEDLAAMRKLFDSVVGALQKKALIDSAGLEPAIARAGRAPGDGR